MESIPLYRDTLRRAWNTTKNYPMLWVFGFFAALLGNGGEFEFIHKQFLQFSSGTFEFGESFLTVLGTGGSNIIQLVTNLALDGQKSYLSLGIIIFAILFLVWIVISAQGSLVRAVAVAPTVHNGNRLSNHLQAGIKSFWHLLAVVIVTRFGALFVLGVLGVPLFALLIYVLNPLIALALVTFVLGIPLLIIASLVTKYAIAYIMLESKKWKDALVGSLRLFFDHWLVSIELAVVLFAINIGAGALIVVSILIFAAPFMLLAKLLAATEFDVIFVIMGQVFGFLLLLILGSILATFQYSSWTELFLKIRKGKHLSKIMRVVIGWREKYR